MRATVFKSTLMLPTCEERLMRPDRGDPFEVWSARDGEVLIRRVQPFRWWSAGTFFRVALRPSGGGTEIEIRSDAAWPVKIFWAIWLGGTFVVACIVACFALLHAFGRHRSSGSSVGALVGLVAMLVFGVAMFYDRRGPSEQRIVADWVRLELDVARTKDAAEPAVAGGRGPRLRSEPRR